MTNSTNQPPSFASLNDDFQDLLNRVRGGSEDAAWDLVERYGKHIQRVIRQRLRLPLRQKVGSDDFAQIVWMSFFRHRSQIVDFTYPEQLIQFLAKTACHKMIDENRKRQTAKYDIDRERALTPQIVGTDPIINRQPTPSQFAIARERWEQMFVDQPDHYREVARMRYMGHTQVEIADTLRMDERTVRKILKKLSIE